LLALAISLGSSLSWGISDFIGGLQSRRLPVLAVLAVSQSAGLLIALAVLPLVGADPLPADRLLIAAGAGAAAIGGLAAFYRGLAVGTMSIVAPVAALGVVVPVFVGLARGEDPGPVQLVGLAVAVVGVVVLSYEEGPIRAGAARQSLALALIAALGFGGFFTLLDLVATDRPGWAIAFVRLGGIGVVFAAVIATRTDLRRTRTAMPALIAVGAFDITANTLFAIASTKGLLPVVAVGGSMYPAFTIALAHLVLGERLASAQRLGVGLALTGVVLIAGGA
jgi:drug/metabolite transporter (DMT)-like permease